MTDFWTPPALKIRPLTRPAVGWQMGDPSTYAVPFHNLKMIRLALLDTIGFQLRQQQSTIAQTDILATQTAAEIEWLRLLNASLPPDSTPLTLEHVVNSRLRYSYEFHWLAQHYANGLTGDGATFWKFLMSRLIGSEKRLVARFVPMSFLYRQLPTLLRPATITPLSFKYIGLRTLDAVWSANDALKPIEQEYEDFYLQDTEALLKTVIKELPSMAHRQPSLFVQQEPTDRLITYQWTTGWHEPPHHSSRVLAIGLLLSALLGVLDVMAGDIFILPRLVIVPFFLALIWVIAMVMRRALGEQEYARREADLRADEQVELLENAQRIDRELHSVLSVERVLSLILDWAIRFTFADTAAVMLVDAQQGTLHTGKHQGFPRELVNLDLNIPVSWQIGITGRAARTGQTCYVPDVLQDANYLSLSKEMRSQLVVPIKRGAEVIAILTLEKKLVDGFSAEEQRRIELLCSRAAIAIINAQLFVEAQREREKLRTLLAAVSEGVIVTDREGKLILVNQMVLDLFNLEDHKDYTQLNFSEAFGNTALNSIYYQENGMREAHIRVEISLQGRAFEVTRIPVQHVGYTLVLHDITPFKELDQLKTDFVQMFSHDIKNPISTIIGSLGYLEMSQELNQRGKDNLGRAERAAFYINQLIDDLLHLTKLEAGIVLDLKPTRLATIIAEAEDAYRMRLEETQLTLEVILAPNLPLVMIDATRIKQVFNNLLGNAIKYTPTGGKIMLTAMMWGNSVEVRMQDTGVGIPEEYLPTIFDKFVRVQSTANSQIKGTGLGLAIVRKLVEAHGGTIRVESTVGQGAAFIFTLPCA
ncbi:MAG: GAF domain-containing protein [Chloroflexi bacterium]|nr:GAF domain-containing protein [Chloroflexota bacterium]